MIKDIHLIRKELIDFVEVSHDYEFKKNILIKYLTLKDGEEGFFTGGKFKLRGNNCLFLENNRVTWQVKINHLNKDGSVYFTPRFFIKDSEEPEQDKDVSQIKELTDKVNYQKNIIEKMTETIKELEIQKHQLSSDKTDYEGLLENNRHNLKNLSMKFRESQEQNEKYKEIINRLTYSG